MIRLTVYSVTDMFSGWLSLCPCALCLGYKTYRVLKESYIVSTREVLHEQLTSAPSSKTILLHRTTQQFMVFGFLLYVPNPLCTELTLPKPQTLMPCCSEPTVSSSFLLFPLTLGISHSSLNWECTLSFLSKHQNKMWSLYAVEMATRAAGLGHVLHASDKNK